MTRDQFLRDMDERMVVVRRVFRLSMGAGVALGLVFGFLFGKPTTSSILWGFFWFLLAMAMVDLSFGLRVIRDEIPRWTWWGVAPGTLWPVAVYSLGWMEVTWYPAGLGIVIALGWIAVGLWVAHRRTMRWVREEFDEPKTSSE